MGKKTINRGLLKVKSYDELLRQAKRRKNKEKRHQKNGLVDWLKCLFPFYQWRKRYYCCGAACSDKGRFNMTPMEVPMSNLESHFFKQDLETMEQRTKDMYQFNEGCLFLGYLMCGGMLFLPIFALVGAVSWTICGGMWATIIGLNTLINAVSYGKYRHHVRAFERKYGHLYLSKTSLAASRQETEEVIEYVKNEIGAVRQKFTGENGELGRLRQEIIANRDEVKATLLDIRKENAFSQMDELRAQTIDVLHGAESTLNDSLSAVEERIASVNAFLNGFEARIIGPISHIETLRAAIEFNYHAKELAERAERATVEVIGSFASDVTRLLAEFVKLSELSTRRLVSSGDIDDLDRTIKQMETSVSCIIGTESDIAQDLSGVVEAPATCLTTTA